MGPIHLKVRYRPVRIAWCVKEGDLEEFRRALRLTHTLWGGRFNPIVPLGHPELTRLLIKTFRVDCLYCISESPEGNAVLAEFKHLLWPSLHKELFIDGMRGRLATFLDVSHPARHLHEDNIRDREHPAWTGAVFRWDPADPLADVLLATFGAYPAENDIGKDYDFSFRENLGAREVEIPNGAALPSAALKEFTPSTLAAFELQPVDYEWGKDEPGLYYGGSKDFTDLVNFWNLRAAGIEVFFYDPAFRARFSGITDQYLAALRARSRDPNRCRDGMAIWNKSREVEIDTSPFGPDLSPSPLSQMAWNGLNIKPRVMGFADNSVLGIASNDGRLSVTFELPPKPFFDHGAFYMQNVVVSVHPLVRTANLVFAPPFLPLLNEDYGREMHLYNTVRSEREGIGVITDLTTHSVTISALDVQTLVNKVFEAFGITAKPSPAGLVGSRLIAQLDGLQGCRVFKIAGVRNLIRTYSADQSFTQKGALTIIGRSERASGKVGFSDYKLLYIDGKHPTPKDAFSYLLTKGVFRPGLCICCPNCGLESWLHLDDARTISRCEYCGKDVNIAPQLKHWHYRRSGLFGRDDHQRGGIPVALTLQQLETALRDRILAYTTGTDLEPGTADMQKCETDFVLIVESPREKTIQVAIGECKSDGGEIKVDDVQKMGRVADALTGNGCEVFIVFSKTSTFAPEEVERCKAAQGRLGRRVILLSERELEPYYLYERAAKEFEISPCASSFEQMAQATQGIYFDPKPKAVAVPTPSMPDVSPTAPAK